MKRATTSVTKIARPKGKVAPHARGKYLKEAHKKAHFANTNKARIAPLPAGYGWNGTLAVPNGAGHVVPPGKLQRGLSEANRKLKAAIDELVQGLGGPYQIREIKFVASFNADGKFMGFGVGGAASIELTVCPCDDD